MKFNPSISFKACVANWEEIYNGIGVSYPFTRMQEYKHYVNVILDPNEEIYSKIKDYINFERDKDELREESENNGIFDSETFYQINYKQKTIIHELNEVPENYPHLAMVIRAKFHNFDEGNGIEYFYNNDGFRSEELEAFRDDLNNTIDKVKIAVQLNIKQQVEMGIMKNYDFTKTDEQGCNLLHYAKSAEIAKLLIEEGADVNQEDKKGQTPIFKARDKELAQTLIENGADLTVKDNKGNDALQIAIYTKNSDLIRVLKANGMSKDYSNPPAAKSKDKEMSM